MQCGNTGSQRLVHLLSNVASDQILHLTLQPCPLKPLCNLPSCFTHTSVTWSSIKVYSRTWKHQFKRREPLSNQYPHRTSICTGSSHVAMTFTRFFCLYTYASPLSTSIKSDRHLMALFWSVMNSLGQHLHMVCVCVCVCVRACVCVHVCLCTCVWMGQENN